MGIDLQYLLILQNLRIATGGIFDEFFNAISKVAATGYSFPSGHTVSATSLYGSVVEHEKDRRRWLAILRCPAASAR